MKTAFLYLFSFILIPFTISCKKDKDNESCLGCGAGDVLLRRLNSKCGFYSGEKTTTINSKLNDTTFIKQDILELVNPDENTLDSELHHSSGRIDYVKIETSNSFSFLNEDQEDLILGPDKNSRLTIVDDSLFYYNVEVNDLDTIIIRIKAQKMY